MKISDKRKKIIAREFLYLSVGIISSVLVLLGASIYQKVHEWKIEQKKEEMYLIKARLDSLKNSEGSSDYAEKKMSSLQLKLFFNDLYSKGFPEFRKQFNSDEKQKNLYSELTKLLNKENSQSYKDIISPKHLSSFTAFKEEYFPTIKDSVENQISKLERKSASLNYDIKYNETVVDGQEFTINYAIIYFIIFFPLRYFYKGIKWSIQTIKN